MPWVFYYLPVYMSAFGVSGFDLGLLLSLSGGLSIAAPLFGTWLASRLGLKRAFLVIDTAANVGYLTPLIVASRREYFVVTYVCATLYSASSPLWETLLVEGTFQEARILGYTVTAVIYLTGSMLTPLAGLVLDRAGLVNGFRLIAAFALTTFLAKTAVLAFMLEEPETVPSGSVKRPSLASAVRLVKGDSRLLSVLAYAVISSVLMQAIPSYLPLYLRDERGARLSLEEAGFIPTLSSVTSLAMLAYATLRPFTQSRGLRYMLTTALSGSVAYTLYLAAMVEPRLAFVAAAVSGLRSVEFSASRTYLVNVVDESDPAAKSHVISLIYSLSSLVAIPAPTIAGAAFSYHPASIWGIALCLSVAEALIVLRLRRKPGN